MKRYYINRVIGNGSHETPYNSELRQYIRDHWPNEPHFLFQAIYAPWCMWCVMKYDLSDAAHADVMANLTGVFDFPSGALDRPLSAIPSAKRQAIRSKLEGIGFDFAWATTSNTIRDVLKYLIHTIQLAAWAEVAISNKNFDVNKTVADVPQEKRQIVNQHLQDLKIDTSWITATTTIGEIVRKIQTTDGTTPRLFGTLRRKQWLYHDEDSE